ncbi:CBU_0592 family membrane protein [Pontibacter ummariensis]
MRKYILEGIGWVGAVFALLAFSLNSLNFISSQSFQYLGMQIFGCSLMALYAASKKAHASWVLNAIFLLIAVIALVRVYIVQS